MFYKKLLLLLLTLFCCQCVQKPAPIFLRGEEFHGKRELDDRSEYYFTKDYFDRVNNSTSNKFNQIIVKEFDDNKDKVDIKYEKCNFIMPAEGSIISSFKASTTNEEEGCSNGITISVNNGANIVSSAPGQVLYIGKGLRWYGNLVIIEHEKNIITLYSFLHNIYVKIGDKIQQGQVIASVYKVNSKVENDKPSLCFSMRADGVTINPLKYINCK